MGAVGKVSGVGEVCAALLKNLTRTTFVKAPIMEKCVYLPSDRIISVLAVCVTLHSDTPYPSCFVERSADSVDCMDTNFHGVSFLSLRAHLLKLWLTTPRGIV